MLNNAYKQVSISGIAQGVKNTAYATWVTGHGIYAYATGTVKDCYGYYWRGERDNRYTQLASVTKMMAVDLTPWLLTWTINTVFQRLRQLQEEEGSYDPTYAYLFLLAVGGFNGYRWLNEWYYPENKKNKAALNHSNAPVLALTAVASSAAIATGTADYASIFSLINSTVSRKQQIQLALHMFASMLHKPQETKKAKKRQKSYENNCEDCSNIQGEINGLVKYITAKVGIWGMSTIPYMEWPSYVFDCLLTGQYLLELKLSNEGVCEKHRAIYYQEYVEQLAVIGFSHDLLIRGAAQATQSITGLPFTDFIEPLKSVALLPMADAVQHMSLPAPVDKTERLAINPLFWLGEAGPFLVDVITPGLVEKIKEIVNRPGEPLPWMDHLKNSVEFYESWRKLTSIVLPLMLTTREDFFADSEVRAYAKKVQPLLMNIAEGVLDYRPQGWKRTAMHVAKGNLSDASAKAAINMAASNPTLTAKIASFFGLPKSVVNFLIHVVNNKEAMGYIAQLKRLNDCYGRQPLPKITAKVHEGIAYYLSDNRGKDAGMKRASYYYQLLLMDVAVDTPKSVENKSEDEKEALTKLTRLIATHGFLTFLLSSDPTANYHGNRLKEDVALALMSEEESKRIKRKKYQADKKPLYNKKLMEVASKLKGTINDLLNISADMALRYEEKFNEIYQIIEMRRQEDKTRNTTLLDKKQEKKQLEKATETIKKSIQQLQKETPQEKQEVIEKLENKKQILEAQLQKTETAILAIKNVVKKQILEKCLAFMSDIAVKKTQTAEIGRRQQELQQKKVKEKQTAQQDTMSCNGQQCDAIFFKLPKPSQNEDILVAAKMMLDTYQQSNKNRLFSSVGTKRKLAYQFLYDALPQKNEGHRLIWLLAIVLNGASTNLHDEVEKAAKAKMNLALNDTVENALYTRIYQAFDITEPTKMLDAKGKIEIFCSGLNKAIEMVRVDKVALIEQSKKLLSARWQTLEEIFPGDKSRKAVSPKACLAKTKVKVPAGGDSVVEDALAAAMTAAM